MSSTCNGLSGRKSEYCKDLVDQCEQLVTGGKKRITLDLRNGNSYTYTDVDLCRAFAKFQASQGVPSGFTPGKKPGGGVTPPTTHHPTTTAPAELVAKKCTSAGPVGSKVFEECKKLISICYASPTGPYSLPTGTGTATIGDQDQCFSLAVFYSKFNESSYGTSYVSTDAGPGWKVNCETTFAASFARVRFAPNKKDTIHIQKLTLPFHYDLTMKGIKITVAYKLQQTSDSRYVIRYHIYYGDHKVPEKVTDAELTKAIGFSCKPDDTIIDTLSFGVTLREKGAFGMVESIDIVKL